MVIDFLCIAVIDSFAAVFGEPSKDDFAKRFAKRSQSVLFFVKALQNCLMTFSG